MSRLAPLQVEFAERTQFAPGHRLITKVVLSHRARTLDEAVAAVHDHWRAGMRFADILDVTGTQSTLVARFDGEGWTGRDGKPLTQVGRTVVDKETLP